MNMVGSLIMVVTQLNLQFCFQGKKLRGFSCELTRSPHGVFPEAVFSIMCQIMVPILLSGLGMLIAGLVMNTIQVRTGHLGAWEEGGGKPGSLGITDMIGQGTPEALSRGAAQDSRAQWCQQEDPPGGLGSEIQRSF